VPWLWCRLIENAPQMKAFLLALLGDAGHATSRHAGLPFVARVTPSITAALAARLPEGQHKFACAAQLDGCWLVKVSTVVAAPGECWAPDVNVLG